VATTPVTGAQARARLAGFVRRPAPVPDAELADRVRFELSHASTTWHLAQPGVSVVGGVVTLSGRAPQHGARADLERVAATVPGVARVDNHMELAGSPS
jgi:osmotically-inducible protein OsmY